MATLRLIELFLEQRDSTCNIRYSGDFDVAGLQMALALAARFGTSFIPWRMDTETYKYSPVYGPALNQDEKERLKRMEIPWDSLLLTTINQVGRKLFQETFINELLEDWLTELHKL